MKESKQHGENAVKRKSITSRNKNKTRQNKTNE